MLVREHLSMYIYKRFKACKQKEDYLLPDFNFQLFLIFHSSNKNSCVPQVANCTCNYFSGMGEQG